ncbi:hypothetical protein ACHAWF_012654 [Thalassiosira exigua]
MPKRKAPAGDGSAAATSPNPRKKSKNEALAAAREWHDRQRKPGVASDDAAADTTAHTTIRSEGAPNETTAPACSSTFPHKKTKKEALAAAKEWHDRRKTPSVAAISYVTARKPHDSNVQGVATKGASALPSETNKQSATKIPPIAQGEKVASAFDKTESSKGGNIFLRSLRGDKTPLAAPQTGDKDMKKDPPVSSKSTNGNSSLPKGSTDVSTNGNSLLPKESADTLGRSSLSGEENDATTRNGHGFVERMLLLFMFALNVTSAAFIYIQHSHNTNIEKEYLMVIEELRSELSKSRSTETVLRMGIEVIEQSHGNNGTIDDLRDIPDMSDDDIDQGVHAQSKSAGGDWLEQMRILDAEKESLLEDLNDQLARLGIEQ